MKFFPDRHTRQSTTQSDTYQMMYWYNSILLMMRSGLLEARREWNKYIEKSASSWFLTRIILKKKAIRPSATSDSTCPTTQRTIPGYLNPQWDWNSHYPHCSFCQYVKYHIPITMPGTIVPMHSKCVCVCVCVCLCVCVEAPHLLSLYRHSKLYFN